MDVEQTIEFILNMQAQAEVNAARHERELRETKALLRRTIRAAVAEARAERLRRQELDARVQKDAEELRTAQRDLDRTFQAYLESLKRGENGSH